MGAVACAVAGPKKLPYTWRPAAQTSLPGSADFSAFNMAGGAEAEDPTEKSRCRCGRKYRELVPLRETDTEAEREISGCLGAPVQDVEDLLEWEQQATSC